MKKIDSTFRASSQLAYLNLKNQTAILALLISVAKLIVDSRVD